jgi:hypothetical protein
MWESHRTTSRRDFLRITLTGAGVTSILHNQSFAETMQRSTPLPAPAFYWGIGIENCWIAQTDPKRDGNRRLLDVFQQMQHDRRWKEDLDLLPATGVNSLRYSVPWYKSEPRPGVYDWSWIDRPVEYLVNTLKIIPIMDLIHYGTPAWMPDGVADERFPEAIGRYAGAMARHFKGLVNHYSPHNEPQLTCAWCGLTGHWPPYRKSPHAWSRIGANVARGMVLETQAIRAAIPDAVILSVDLAIASVADAYARLPADDPRWPEFRLASSYYPASLAYGKIIPGHPLADLLMAHGVKEAEVAWFQQHAARPDMVGCNSYPDFGFGWSGQPPEARKNDFTRRGSMPLERAAREAVESLTATIKRAQDYFRLPVFLTETSAGVGIEARVAYIEALGRWVRRMRDEGVPVKGVNWWPLFDTIQWDYREQTDRPLTDFLYEGGWNNGLYRIEPQPGGELRRVSTGAVEAFRRITAH